MYQSNSMGWLLSTRSNTDNTCDSVFTDSVPSSSYPSSISHVITLPQFSIPKVLASADTDTGPRPSHQTELSATIPNPSQYSPDPDSNIPLYMFQVSRSEDGEPPLCLYVSDPDGLINTKSETTETSVFAYKPVAKRTRPIAGIPPEEFRIIRRFPSDPLDTLPVLPTTAPPFSPGVRYTEERRTALNVNPVGFMWPEEEKLAHEIIRINEMALAWDESDSNPGTNT